MLEKLKLKEVEYKALSARSILRQMKDLVSLMLDLAYFAFLTNDQTLTDLVLKVEEEINTLNYFLMMNTMLAVRDKDDAEVGAVIINMGNALSSMANAAADIAQLSKMKIAPHSVLKKALERTEETVKSCEISRESLLVNKRLEDLEKLKIYADVIAVKRETVWILNPPPNFKLKAGDIVVCRGNKDSIDYFYRVCRYAKEKR